MDDQQRSRDRRWAVVRVALGTLQVTGACMTFILLGATGASQLTIAVASVTALVTGASILLFKGK